MFSFFLRLSGKGLCSDGFSGWLASEPEAKAINQELEEATRFLKKEMIPNFVKQDLIGPVDTERNCQIIHR